jgi:DNA-binding transcriptional LysR family regulator
MNLRHMEVFHAIYVNGSVVRAARALNVSQPSVSKVLAHAEIQLGFPLFQRLRGRLIPTDEAHVLFRQVSEIHTRLASVRQTSRNLKGGVGGYLRLAVLPALGLAAAPEAVATLLKRHPSINIDVQTMHHTDILRSLIERDSDLAIGYEEPNHPRLDSRRIGEAELVVFFPKTLIPEPPDRISLKALEDMVVISLANSGPLGNLFSNETVEHNLDIKEQISVRTFYVAAGLVKAGAGVAVIDELTARATLSDELDFRPLDPPISFGVHCIFLVDRPPSILGNEFISIFSKILEQ